VALLSLDVLPGHRLDWMYETKKRGCGKGMQTAAKKEERRCCGPRQPAAQEKIRKVRYLPIVRKARVMNLPG